MDDRTGVLLGADVLVVPRPLDASVIDQAGRHFERLIAEIQGSDGDLGTLSRLSKIAKWDEIRTTNV